jgi:hypothetical protein
MSRIRNTISSKTKVYGAALVILVAAFILLKILSGERVNSEITETFFGLGNWILILISLIVGFLIGLAVINKRK